MFSKIFIWGKAGHKQTANCSQTGGLSLRQGRIQLVAGGLCQMGRGASASNERAAIEHVVAKSSNRNEI